MMNIKLIKQIEGLMKRNEEKYPYKIGDRVILKGSNRCATITDLKYNSWGNLSYYIKIDNDKDISIDYPTNLLLPYDNKVEGLVEEKTKPKFKVGDRIITDTNMKGKIIEDVEEGWYRVEFKPYNNIPQSNSIVPEESMSLVEEEVGLVNEFNLPEGYIFKDENGNIINTTKIVLEKKKKEYPKSLDECLEALGYTKDILLSNQKNLYSYKVNLLADFQKLLICRDAYWEIAGEEMGLGKPWEPDYKTEDNNRIYVLTTDSNVVVKSSCYHCNYILAFPTEEMRDIFYENFKSEIESCKKLL